MNLKKLCPRNLYILTKNFFKNRKVGVTFNDYIYKQAERGCPQGSCSGPLYWNIIYNSLLKIKCLPKDCEIIGFADDTLILLKHQSRDQLQMRQLEVLPNGVNLINNQSTLTKVTLLFLAKRNPLRKTFC